MQTQSNAIAEAPNEIHYTSLSISCKGVSNFFWGEGVERILFTKWEKFVPPPPPHQKKKKKPFIKSPHIPPLIKNGKHRKMPLFIHQKTSSVYSIKKLHYHVNTPWFQPTIPDKNRISRFLILSKHTKKANLLQLRWKECFKTGNTAGRWSFN